MPFFERRTSADACHASIHVAVADALLLRATATIQDVKQLFGIFDEGDDGVYATDNGVLDGLEDVDAANVAKRVMQVIDGDNDIRDCVDKGCLDTRCHLLVTVKAEALTHSSVESFGGFLQFGISLSDIAGLLLRFFEVGVQCVDGLGKVCACRCTLTTKDGLHHFTSRPASCLCTLQCL